jgi:hypothetical protein
METWFLLFSGSSPDGRGNPHYSKRTTDKAEARRHYERCKKDPYSVGKVQIITDGGYSTASENTDWDSV